MKLNKRELLAALVALGAGAVAPAAVAQPAALDVSAGRAIGEAYLAAHPAERLPALAAELLPAGLSDAALARLRAQAAADFGAGAVFVYEGWRLSRTEARLFALLTAA
jgi:hypothetical protein